jgi:hypothetical protein
LIVANRVFDFWLLLLSLGIIGYSIVSANKGKKIEIRPIAGYDAINEAVGRAAEMGRPVHYTPGWAGLVAATFAGLEVLGEVTKQCAQYNVRLVTSVSNPETYAVTEQVMMQAYTDAGVSELWKSEDCRFVSADGIAAVSAVVGIMNREKIASNIMIGQFTVEALILAEAGNSVGALQIAGTSNIVQLPFFIVACDYTILGDEMFAAGAYFGKNKLHLGSLRGEDILKAACIGLMVIGAILNLAGSKTLTTLMSR